MLISLLLIFENLDFEQVKMQLFEVAIWFDQKYI